ncbi:hypothetical protein [Mangrovihabitans endophyticus]|uniref:hypothetical protein n=1 Tax=Mangrovihabitans endophyticus TaxID=1751298 RepID=UPI00166BE31A|nr:hypothetical protein [Mangrovihabitans endophyticus]
MTARAREVAGQATCRALDQATTAYLVDHDAAPRTVEDLRPYVRGDISGYRIDGGLPTGPGCPD